MDSALCWRFEKVKPLLQTVLFSLPKDPPPAGVLVVRRRTEQSRWAWPAMTELAAPSLLCFHSASAPSPQDTPHEASPPPPPEVLPGDESISGSLTATAN